MVAIPNFDIKQQPKGKFNKPHRPLHENTMRIYMYNQKVKHHPETILTLDWSEENCLIEQCVGEYLEKKNNKN